MEVEWNGEGREDEEHGREERGGKGRDREMCEA